MIEFSVDVDDNKVPAALSEVAGTLYDDIVSDAIHPYLDKVRDRAKRRHRFKSRTGKLERSIRSQHTGDGGSVYIDDGLAPYGEYVHDGSKHMSADTFIEDAMDDRELDMMIDKVLDKAIKKAGL